MKAKFYHRQFLIIVAFLYLSSTKIKNEGIVKLYLGYVDGNFDSDKKISLY